MHGAAYKQSAIWKGIVSVRDNYMQNIRYQAYLGKEILFWLNTWTGEDTLASKFLDLFNCAIEKKAKVESYIERSSMRGHVSWSPTFRRNLKEHEENQFLSLQTLLRGPQIPEEGEDTRIWKASRNGVFSVSSFYSTLSAREGSKCGLASLWRFKAPPRIVAFRWIEF